MRVLTIFNYITNVIKYKTEPVVKGSDHFPFRMGHVE